MEHLKRYAGPVFLAGLAMLAAGLPFSKFLMSLGQFFLLGAWLMYGNYKFRIRSFLQNPTALLLSAVFFLHLIGLIYSADFNYGLEDVRKKIPLFLIPFLIVTSPIVPPRQLSIILNLFLASVFVASLVSLYRLFFMDLTDVRQASAFISHIRFALMAALAVFISLRQGFVASGLPARIFYFFLPVWLLFSLVMMQAMTGLIAAFLAAFVTGIWMLFNNKSGRYRNASLGLAAIMIAGLFSGILLFNRELNQMKLVNVPDVKLKSEAGNIYSHYPDDKTAENRNLVYVNVAWIELEEAWNRVSERDFRSLDQKGNEIKFTLLRFLTSKNLDKDSAAVSRLGREEILAIESGIPNVEYMDDSPLVLRIKNILWEINEYQRSQNPNGHSLTMRIEFARVALSIWSDNLLFGTGTGDVVSAFNAKYIELDSRLEDRWRLRSHNQFLEMAVALGAAGLLLFLASLIVPVFKKHKYSHPLYISFFVIMVVSMFSDDTLETQAGVTFYTFFNSIFLFQRLPDKVTRSVTKKVTVETGIQPEVV